MIETMKDDWLSFVMKFYYQRKKKIAKSIEKQLDNNFILICIKYDEQW